jgi:hypothetical protein
LLLSKLVSIFKVRVVDRLTFEKRGKVRLRGLLKGRNCHGLKTDPLPRATDRLGHFADQALKRDLRDE